ncbi:hypothetical protein DH2020_019696 [Rehmannia glutinosa]|uniref:F-box associated beta-propeller type 3 domain-containing protein n=1 Tax=Rehmannia glutinosa TaxID=99300 RepID=A0ABR0WHV2_REHGL
MEYDDLRSMVRPNASPRIEAFGLAQSISISYRTYTLWNPSTRTKVMIWFPYKFDEYMKHGICHDTTIDDFKVVVASRKCYTVYSCKNKSWTKRKQFSDSFVGRSPELGGVAVDGAIYWGSNRYSRTTNSYSREIIYFDARDDNFRILERPKNVNDYSYYLVCLRGCLRLYRRIRPYDVQIWIKEKGRDNNSWKELMIVENVKMPLSLFKPLYFVENKIVIRLDDRLYTTRFVVCNPCEKTFEEFEESKLSLEINLVPCQNSLLCPIQNTRPKRKRN